MAVRRIFIVFLFLSLVAVPFVEVSAVPPGVGVMGDSATQPYRCMGRGDSTSFTWTEILARLRNIDFGGEPCEPYNQAWSGETVALNMASQTDDIVADFNSGHIGRVIIMLGHNDLYGNPNTPDVNAILATYRVNLDVLLNAGIAPANILIVDVSQENWDGPMKAYVDQFNTGLRNLSIEKGTWFTSWVAFHTEAACRSTDGGNTYNIGGQVINNAFGNEYHNWRVADGHLGTLANGVFANALFTNFLGVARMSDAELLSLVNGVVIPSNPPPACSSTPTPSLSPTVTRTPTVTLTPPTITPSTTPTFTLTATGTSTATFTPTATGSSTATLTRTATSSSTATITPTITLTPTFTPSPTHIPTQSSQATSTPVPATLHPYMRSQILVPVSQTTQFGTMSGSLSSLGLLQQTGTEDEPAAYLSFQTPNTVYLGYTSFHLPADARANLISTMLLQINFKGPSSSAQRWTWSAYDWNTGLWIKLGDTVGVKANEWQTLLFRIRQPWPYISSAHEVRIQLRSDNSNGDAKLDYEALHITYLPVPATPTLVPPITTPKRPGFSSVQ